MFKNLFLGNTSINFYEKRKLLQNVLIIEVLFFLIVFISASLGLLNCWTNLSSLLRLFPEFVLIFSIPGAIAFTTPCNL